MKIDQSVWLFGQMPKLVMPDELSNKAIIEIEYFFDWIVILRVESEVAARKKVTSLPGPIAPL